MIKGLQTAKYAAAQTKAFSFVWENVGLSPSLCAFHLQTLHGFKLPAIIKSDVTFSLLYINVVLKHNVSSIHSEFLELWISKEVSLFLLIWFSLNSDI